ncbi:HupE/UreJ family protein [Paenibacillus aestuarii]|uniref:HupE/UreJ family protein n=1 Tax=Paenibacillus aestuarii TaxID=516965 RepID=A0ABW0KBR5_9BACL|nr:HupE/UreJ family protein [Paenibacillus aestuarii]
MNLRMLFSLLIFVLFFGTASTSFAHTQSMGYSDIYVKANEINYSLFLDQQDLLGQMDANKDNDLENEELLSQKGNLKLLLQKELRIDVDSNPLKMDLISMNLATKGSTRGVVFQLKFTADEVIEQINIHYNLVFEDTPSHTSVLMVHSGAFFYQDVLDINKKDIQVTFPQSETAQSETGFVLWKYFVLGIEHILSGYDHLLFLLSLLLIASHFKDALKIVTAFTVAHSITLFLVASGRIHVISSWVEVLIALTICYVAMENLFVQKAKWRWILTALFGLVHGMGFAGALAETGLPKRNLLGSLVTFNLGVEAGQLMILCLLLPLLIWLRRFPWYRKMMISTSCFIFLLAFYWSIQRLQ